MDTPELDKFAATLDGDNHEQFVLLAEIWAVQRSLEEYERLFDAEHGRAPAVSTVIEGDKSKWGAFMSFAWDYHVSKRHRSEVFGCDHPICALANAIVGVADDGTYPLGNYAVTITVTLGEDAPA